MAYAPRRRTTRTRYAPARRAAPRRAPARRTTSRRSSPNTIKIVVETAPASAISRDIGPMIQRPMPAKAKL